MDSLLNLSPQQLRQAADLQERIESLQQELAQLLGTPTEAGKAQVSTVAPGKRYISPAGRARIAAAARARWAKLRGEKAPAATAQKPKRKMSAAAKAKLAALAKARWKKAKAAGKLTL